MRLASAIELSPVWRRTKPKGPASGGTIESRPRSASTQAVRTSNPRRTSPGYGRAGAASPPAPAPSRPAPCSGSRRDGGVLVAPPEGLDDLLRTDQPAQPQARQAVGLGGAAHPDD